MLTLGMSQLGSRSIINSVGQRPLDFVSALLSLGLRRLVTLYSAPLVRVRRSTDSAELDIYSNSIDGWIDTGTLFPWVRHTAITLSGTPTIQNVTETFPTNRFYVPGAYTATMTENNATGYHRRIFETVTMPGGAVTVSFWVARVSGVRNVYVWMLVASGTYAEGSFDLGTGVFTSVGGVATTGVVTPAQRNGLNGYIVSFTSPSSTTSFSGQIGIEMLSGASRTYTGDSTSSIMVQDFGVYPGATAPSAFVPAWYGQSTGGINATQATAANQPRIVNSGVLETLNDRPALVFSGAQFLTLSSALTGSVWTWNLIMRQVDTATRYVILNVGNSFAIASSIVSPNHVQTWSGNDRRYSGYVANANHILTAIYNATASQTFYNGNNLPWTASATSGTNAPGTIRIGVQLGAGTGYNGAISEVVAFNSVLTTENRQNLERDQGAAYGITVA